MHWNYIRSVFELYQQCTRRVSEVHGKGTRRVLTGHLTGLAGIREGLRICNGRVLEEYWVGIGLVLDGY